MSLTMRARLAPVAPLCAAALLAGGCATSSYQPQVVARGEITLRYDGTFEMWAGGRRVSRGLGYAGLERYVGCVPAARGHARQAARHGVAAVTLSVLGGTLGVAGLAGLYGLYDKPNQWIWLGSGIASAAVGTVLAGLGRKYRNSANGHAVDAVNFYNDSVGSLGATCDDLRYPLPAGPLPPAAAPPAPAVPGPDAAQETPPG